MKSFKLLVSVIALAVIAAAPVLRAEDAPAKPKAERGHGDRVKELTAKLGLSDEQVTKIKPIVADEMQAMKALRDDTSTDRKAKNEKRMEIQKSHNDQIMAILTPEQQTKFKAMLEHRGGKKKDKGEAPAS